MMTKMIDTHPNLFAKVAVFSEKPTVSGPKLNSLGDLLALKISPQNYDYALTQAGLIPVLAARFIPMMITADLI